MNFAIAVVAMTKDRARGFALYRPVLAMEPGYSRAEEALAELLADADPTTANEQRLMGQDSP